MYLQDRPVAKKAGRVDVEAHLDPGPRVDGGVRGRSPPRRLAHAPSRASTGPGSSRPAALEEMRLEALRALRALGHLEPEVEVDGRRRRDGRRVVVTVRAPAGRSTSAEVAFEGVSAAGGGRPRPALPSPSSESSWPPRFRAPTGGSSQALPRPRLSRRARILERALEDGGRLAVERRPRPSVPRRLRRGPRRAGRGGRAALAPRARLARRAGRRRPDGRSRPSRWRTPFAPRGFAEARVRTALSPATPEDPPRLAVVFDVRGGTAERLGSVTFEGLSRTSARWARQRRGPRRRAASSGARTSTGRAADSSPSASSRA